MIRFTIIVVSLLALYELSFTQQLPWHRAKGTEGIDAVGMDVYRKDPDTLYAVGLRVKNGSGGPSLTLRSTDRGVSWDSIYTGACDGAIKVNPINSEIVYATFDTYCFVPTVNITTNGGVTWRKLFEGRDYPIVVIEIDPMNPNVVYVGDGGAGLARTTDNGQTWQGINIDTLLGYTTSLAISATNDSILYVVGAGGMSRSTDFGGSWTQLFPQAAVNAA